MGGITVAINSNTQFDGFDACAAANATCVQSGQSVEVDLMLLASGTFLAKKIELRDDAQQAADDELEGIVSKIDSPSQFEMVVNDELRAVANVSVGDPVTVMLTTSGGGTSFQVDANGLAVPSTLQQGFEGATDTSQLLPGQTVQVRKLTMTGGPAPAAITITTDRVRLRDTRFTATVSGAPTGSNFNVGGLPGLFTAEGVSQILVQTSSQTNFENVSGVSGLADGSTVSLRGLLFKKHSEPGVDRGQSSQTMRNLALRDAGPEVSPTPLWGRLWDPLVIVRLSSERTVTKSFPFSEKSGRPFESSAGWSRTTNRAAKQLQSRTGLWLTF